MERHHISWANWAIADKAEACAALQPGSVGTGGWALDQLTASGSFVRSTLRGERQNYTQPPTPAGPGTCAGDTEDCSASKCCADPDRKCYVKDEHWASCMPGTINPDDLPQYQTPWSCELVAPPTQPTLAPIPAPTPALQPEPTPTPDSTSEPSPTVTPTTTKTASAEPICSFDMLMIACTSKSGIFKCRRCADGSASGPCCFCEKGDPPSTTTATTTAPGLCKQFCGDHEKPWQKKCRWHSCLGCPECNLRRLRGTA